MIWEEFRTRISDINSWLLAALFFCIPIHVAPAFIISFLMMILWVIEGDFKKKWQRLRANPLFWIFQAYFWIFVISLLWTENLAEGRRIAGRSTFIFLSPIFLTVVRKEHINRYVHAFLISVAISELFAYYNWLRLHMFPQLPIGFMAKKGTTETAPFVDRVMYAPILAFAGYLAAYKFVFSTYKFSRRVLYLVLLLATAVNLVFSGGRTGQLAFAILIGLVSVQYFSKRPFLGIFTGLILICGVFAAAYTTNTNFRERADLAVYEVVHFRDMAGKEDVNSSSVGLRITFWTNSLQVFMENPLIGVGAGDYMESYVKVNQRLSPAVRPQRNPHNQYLFVLATTGLLGGVIMLMLYLPPGLWQYETGDLPKVKVALAVFFLVISMFDSYIYRSNTCLMYVLFASAIYFSGTKFYFHGLKVGSLVEAKEP